MARTLTIEAIVRGTFEYPEGCDDQKIAFLRSLGIDELEISNFKHRTFIEPTIANAVIFWTQSYHDGSQRYSYCAVKPHGGSLWYTSSGDTGTSRAPTGCSWEVLADWLKRWRVQDVHVVKTWAAVKTVT